MPQLEINKRIVEVFEWQKKSYGFATQQIFAEKIGVSFTTINEIFNNKKGAGMSVIGGILSTFVEVDARWLITGEGMMLIEQNKINPDEIENLREDLQYHKKLVMDLIEIAKSRNLA